MTNNTKILGDDELYSILADWNVWHKDQDIGVSRPAYLDRLASLITSGQVTVITGARRSGKSFLLKQLAARLIQQGVAKENILMVNFEDPRFIELDVELLERLVKVYQARVLRAGKPYIFLDEIQNVRNWEKWVRMYHELDKATLVITGSNSKLLSGELATVLTGRHMDLTVYPLSFSEYLDFSGVNQTDRANLDHTKLLNYYRQYLTYGGLPGIFQTQEKDAYLLNYYSDIVEKDLLKRYKIRKADKFKALLKFYISNVAGMTTLRSAGNFLGLNSSTVERFSGYFEEAFIASFVSQFSFKYKEQLKSPRKIYPIDTGLANVVGFQFSQNLGKMTEAIVFLQLLRDKQFTTASEIYYWKDRSGNEVDFLVRTKETVTRLIQVCWDVSNPLTKKRETGALTKAMKEFSLARGVIVTENYEGTEVDKNGAEIIYIPIWQWLLREDLQSS